MYYRISSILVTFIRYFIFLGCSRIKNNRFFGFIGIAGVLCRAGQYTAKEADKRYEYGGNTTNWVIVMP